MIPVTLRLRNFMCYQGEHPPLEFEEIRIACLSGPNGAGKSTLLDAMTWALWGRSRSRSDDALISIGAQEMEVEFEFLLEGNRYRVFRRRDRAARGGQGKTQLELQIQGPQGWRAMGGDNVRQTEQKIVELLRMDYDTFINSALLLQGRADEFSIKPPAERKKVLAEILGLSLYDELEQKARERWRAEERTVQSLAILLEDLERRLAGRQEQAEALERAQEEAAQAEEELGRWQEDLAGLQGRVAELEAMNRQSADLHRRLTQTRAEVEQVEGRLVQQENRIAAAQALLERADEIEADYTRLAQLRDRQELLSQAAGRLLALSERQRHLEQVMERARNEYITEREVLRRSLSEGAGRLQERSAIDQRLHEIEAELADLKQQDTRRAELLRESQEHVAETRSLQTDNKRLKEEMAQLREKVDMLGEYGVAEEHNCPLCQSPLDQKAYENIRNNYQAEGEARRDQYRANENQIHQLEDRLTALQAEQDRLEQELRRGQVLEGQRAALEKERQELGRREQEQEEKKGRLQQIEQVLADSAYAEKERAELAALQKEIAGLHYDRDEHQSIQREMARLKTVEDEFHRLQNARERLSEEQGRVEELRASRQLHQDEASVLEQEAQALEVQLADLPALQAERQEVERSMRAAQDTLGQARSALGAAQRELEQLEQAEQLYNEKKSAHNLALERREVYEDLSTSLGKRGVQAMLIETAVPEIEREANELLGRMTDGEMALQLAMQRETKQGTAVETLDIKISDAQGTRDLELFSGGENFRINFALRIALSRLLARRAGASLQTLVIDEGFGTQDASGRERLVEAIRSIEPEFEKILVITHIEELKEAFPVRIEIERTAEGSRWTVS